MPLSELIRHFNSVEPSSDALHDDGGGALFGVAQRDCLPTHGVRRLA